MAPVAVFPVILEGAGLHPVGEVFTFFSKMQLHWHFKCIHLIKHSCALFHKCH